MSPTPAPPGTTSPAPPGWRHASKAELRETQLDLLKRFAQLCDRNGLTYYLQGGTLLGAALWQGFIPWDDDVDVSMPRADFDRLPSAMAKDPSLADLTLLSTRTLKDYPYPFAKLGLVGTRMVDHTARDRVFPINIDIFPVDTRASGLRRLWQDATMHLTKRTIQAAQLPDTRGWRILVAWAGRAVSRIVGSRRLADSLNAVAACGGQKSNDFVGLLVWGPGRSYPVSNYRHGRRLPFEGQYFSVPRGSEEILTVTYGSRWRIVPPKEEQFSPHGFTAFVREDEGASSSAA